MASRGKSLGTVYRGGQGQWSWALHRITGVGIIFFLFVHVADTALVALGPEIYDRVIKSYHNPVVKLFEIGLAAMVLFHALNGLKIIAIDFFPKLADHHRQLFGIVIGLYLALFTPALYFMGKSLLRSL